MVVQILLGEGCKDNIVRIVPDGLCAKIDLNKIKTQPIFKWLKNNGINDKEMLKTFNCGIGFCLVIDKKYLKIIQKSFIKNYRPYVIGKIIEGNKNIYQMVKLTGKKSYLQQFLYLVKEVI